MAACLFSSDWHGRGVRSGSTHWQSLAGLAAALIATIAVVIWMMPGPAHPLIMAQKDLHFEAGRLLATRAKEVGNAEAVVLLRGPDTFITRCRVAGFREAWPGSGPPVIEVAAPVQFGRIAWDADALVREVRLLAGEPLVVSLVGLPPRPRSLEGWPRCLAFDPLPGDELASWKAPSPCLLGTLVPERSDSTGSDEPGSSRFRWILPAL